MLTDILAQGDALHRGMRGIDLDHIGREAEGIFGGRAEARDRIF